MNTWKLGLVALGLLTLLAGCGTKDTGNKGVASDASAPNVATAQDATTTSMSVVSDAAISKEPVKKSEIIKKADLENYEGAYYFTEENGYRGFNIYRVSKDKVWFQCDSILGVNAELFTADAIGNNTYEFRYDYIKDKNYPCYRTKKDGQYKGTIQFNGTKIHIKVDAGNVDFGDNTVDATLNKRTKTVVKEIYQMESGLDNFKKTQNAVYKVSRPYMQLGKQREKNAVAYCFVDPASIYTRKLDYFNYTIEGVGFLSTRAECDQTLGKPLQVESKENYTYVTYAYRGNYQIEFVFNDMGVVKRFGCYYESKQKATEKYKDGDFLMSGCRIMKYNGKKSGTKNIVFPKDAIAVAKDAFCAKNTKGLEKINMTIPKKLYLEPYSFENLRNCVITFEEGRKIIERKSFFNCAVRDRRGEETVKITLPSSVRTLQKEAFFQEWSLTLKLKLNEGLKVVGEAALSGTHAKLPSTVKALGKEALGNWWYTDEEDYDEVVLPEGLEEIGDGCISVEWSKRRIHIPASVKKIGYCFLSYGDNPYAGGVEVDKNNPYFKSNSKGWLFSKDGTVLYYASSFKGDLVVPNTVKKIMGHLELDPNGECGPQKVVLPNGLQSIDKSRNVELQLD